MYKNILVPTDGSPLSRKAIAAAVALAKCAGATVTGFFAAPSATPIVYRGMLPVGVMKPEEHEALIEKTAAKYLGVIEDLARKAGVKCEVVHLTNDFPADAIITVARKKKCDLIFMASHGRRGLENVLGSDTQKVVSRSPIPVLVHR
jgi:nucleotide-binding universal stress UspA family protein